MWNPKNILIITLCSLLVIVSGMYAWQYNTVARQDADISKLKLSNSELSSEVIKYNQNINDAKEVQEQHQIISNHTETIREQIKYIQTDCKLGEQNEKIINNFTGYFNDGMHSKNSNSKTSEKVLSETNKANSSSGKTAGTIN